MNWPWHRFLYCFPFRYLTSFLLLFLQYPPIGGASAPGGLICPLVILSSAAVQAPSHARSSRFPPWGHVQKFEHDPVSLLAQGIQNMMGLVDMSDIQTPTFGIQRHHTLPTPHH
ncbi:hypothetical protein B0T25DRAFT_153865 [Lasiosphaeria hispida]|uniref:Uncharacterized protein n=1 Tax=Lasiosphaeria hispida TaxID=260671 RepID=A0AAJ0MG12_9PEZI|nr:hypothetical protein B0T25DRAFT_153865 [Lasiosphaeria hispida]